MPSEDKCEQLEELARAIQKSYKESTFPSGRDESILPEESLKSLITLRHVEIIINNPNLIDGSPDKALVDFVLRKATKLIAILLAIDLRGDELRKAIISFIHNQKFDQNLPLDRQALQKLACYRAWRALQQESFIRYQWRFLAPRFLQENALYRVQFDQRTLFPFRLSNLNPPKGGFGTVWRAEVHTPHLGHRHSCEVAIKELAAQIDTSDTNSRTYKTWEREAQALREFSRTHKHIVEIFAIFSHSNKEYFMFPWAEGGDLNHFIRTRDDLEANRDPKFVLDILSQLIGLASAIETIHKQKYRHGDLKPQNILIFTEGSKVGTWKIADLGLAKFHNEATGARVGPTSMIGNGTISYEPPETVTTSDSPRSRLYDIWSMGCIILEIVVSLLYGRKAYDILVSKTKNPASKNHSATWEGTWNGRQWMDTKVHREVLGTIDRLEEDFRQDKLPGAGAAALVELADLVKRRLLVVRLPPERGSWTQSARRARADEVHQELKSIEQRLRHYLDSHPPSPARQDHLQVLPLTNNPRDTVVSAGRPGLESWSSRRHSSNQVPGSHVSHRTLRKKNKKKKTP